MKLRHPLLAATMLGAIVTPTAMFATNAAAQSPTQVWVTNAFSHAAGATYDFTICLDGTSLASLSTTNTSGPTTVDSGDHEVEVHDGLAADCGEKPDFTRNITIPEGAGSTLALFLPYDSDGEIAVFPEDMSCVQAGTGRVKFRNLATYDSDDTFDMRATPPGGNDTALVSDVGVVKGGSADVTAGTYNGATIDTNGTTDLVANVAQGVLTVSETTQEVVYTYGGADGDIGTYVAELPSSVCDEQTSTTAATTTTLPTTVARVATPVAAKPTYTG